MDLTDRPADAATPHQLPSQERAGDHLLVRALGRARWTIFWERLWPSLKAGSVLPLARAISRFATYHPCCLATGATPGSGLRSGPVAAAASPITKTFGWPGTERSPCTFTRPARSHSALSHSAAGEALTPAAQMIVRVCRRSWPSETPEQ